MKDVCHDETTITTMAAAAASMGKVTTAEALRFLCRFARSTDVFGVVDLF